jgi:cytoskeletal protein RodZ
MSWYWWMVLGAVLALVARWWLQDLFGSLRPVKTCEWCRRASGGHQVTGHSWEECEGPRADRRAEEHREADRRSKQERRQETAAAKAATNAENIARLAAKLRIIQVGTITTRHTSRRNEINVSGWHFDQAGPYSGPSSPNAQAVAWEGAPEQAHGWTLLELHTIAHGGSCRCDVLDLARHVRH